MAHDPSTRRLFVVDATQERLLIFGDDLSQQLAVLPLDQQPDRLIFDPAARRLYISLPAIAEIIAVEVDQLRITARASLSGGPILQLAFDAEQHRLYALSVLAPSYRGITLWQTPELARLDLVAGVGDFPLRSATDLDLTAAGDLLIPEATGLWQISPLDFAVSNAYPGDSATLVKGLTVSQKRGTIYILEATPPRLRIY